MPYDKKGNLFDGRDSVVKPATKPVGDDHFYCIICKEVKPLKGNVIASLAVGGWYCGSHEFDVHKNLVIIKKWIKSSI